ncbi:hypothetical protein CRI93_08225 [Longimonas halophila]|uniref:Fibronectin type-III domain-containing protein n=1 Tax=Longimonas halophila TaxID=1469170 RepID=A0A2H3P7J4_9BACT|nr:T9SS type A sorting domain-containing protein [Longimonas halophila]PEN07111.1 hypothetical protein CRI93_08225 [Longimonas halophila]
MSRLSTRSVIARVPVWIGIAVCLCLSVRAAASAPPEAPASDLQIDWANLQFPPSLSHVANATDSTSLVYGQVYIAGVTDAQDTPVDSVRAQVGYGPAGTSPQSDAWRWFDMRPNPGYDYTQNNDEYIGKMLPQRIGTFKYTTRWSVDGGQTWTYTDQFGPPYDEVDAGDLTVAQSSDTTPPSTPLGLNVTDVAVDEVSLTWNAIPDVDEDAFGYAVYRKAESASSFTKLTELEDLFGVSNTSYTDATAAPGTTYDYQVTALDVWLNESPASPSVQATTPAAVALTGGGAGGLNRTFSATPGASEQPIGAVRIAPGQSGATLTELVATPDAPSATGIDKAALWISADDAFDAASDTELARIDLDPQAGLPATLSFDGFTEALPNQARTLFLTVTLTEQAAGGITMFLADATALALDGGQIVTVNGTSQQSFSNLALSASDAPLPVELAGFEAQRAGSESVTLQWRTLSETNNAGFEVQRATASADGSANGPANASVETSQVETPHWDVSTGESWQTIAHLEGAGTTNEPQSYRFEDTDLPYAADRVRYRLRQIDTDGTESFSEPITVAREVTAAELLPTYPNPARGPATVRFATPERQDVRIALYDLLGRRVQTVVDTNAAGRTEAQLDVSDLASGTYFVRMQTDGFTDTQRLTVVR